MLAYIYVNNWEPVFNKWAVLAVQQRGSREGAGVNKIKFQYFFHKDTFISFLQS